MEYYEVIFESGDHSVMAAPNKHEILSFASTHHARAIAGEPGGPAGYPAERINRILVYSRHPADLSVRDAVSKDVATSMIKAAKTQATDEDGVVSMNVLIHGLVNQIQPVKETPPRESNYDAEPSSELDPADWDGGE